MKRLTFSIILLSSLLLLNPNLIQCKDHNDYSKSTIHELKSKIVELKKDLKQVESDKDHTKEISEKTHYQIIDKIKKISLFIFEQVKFIADKSDKIVSKKFFLAAMILLGPPIVLYCKLFGVELTGAIINKITGIFLGGGTQAAKNIAEAVIDKTPEITEVAIDKGQEIAEKVIDTAASKIIENPKTIAKILGAWAGLSVAKEVIVQTIIKVGDQLGKKASKEVIVPIVLTSFSLISNPLSLLVTIPAFAAHLYYQH